MPYSGYQDRRNEFYRNRDLYYEYNSRTPVYTANPVSDSDALSIRDKFCPLHGQVAKFDMLIKNAYIYTCCGMTVPNDEMGIDVRDAGITTIDGRTSRNPHYGRSASNETGIIVPAGQPRSSARNKKIQLSPDDAKMAKHGYEVVKTQEKIGTSRLMQQNLGSSQTDSYRRNPIQEKYRRIHGLGHI